MARARVTAAVRGGAGRETLLSVLRSRWYFCFDKIFKIEYDDQVCSDFHLDLELQGARSRISTLSSMTPDTSVEQSTCVERCSSSFEEELIRNNKTHETEIGDDNAFSASDSDDSAEAGGNLTHHRFALFLL